jgi:hypothetical protein
MKNLTFFLILKTPSKSLLLYDRIFQLVPSAQGLCWKNCNPVDEMTYV